MPTGRPERSLQSMQSPALGLVVNVFLARATSFTTFGVVADDHGVLSNMAL
jgi:hypothetical protein